MALDLTPFDEVDKEPKNQGLDLSAFDEQPEQPQVVQAQATQSEPSQLEALVRSLGQGVSLGLSDEAAGALTSPIGAAKAAANIVGAGYDLGDPDYQRYVQSREESREAQRAAQAAHPGTYMAGEVLGGFAIPGIGLSGAGIKGLSGISKFGARALEGAALGATGAVGMTEDEGTDVLGEAAKGGALGGAINPIFGRLLDAIVPTTKAVGGQLVDPDIIANAYEKAKSGTSLAGKETLERTQQDLFNYIRNDLMPLVLDDTKKVVSGAYDEALANARAQGRTVRTQDVQDAINAMAQKESMAPEDVKRINDALNRFGQREEIITGVKQVKPKVLDPQAQFEQNQLDKLMRQQDVKEMRSQLARAGEPSLGGQQPGLFQGQGPAFGSELLAAKSQSASPTIVAKTPYQGKGEYSTIDYITQEVFSKPNLTVDDLTSLKQRLDILAKSADPAESYAAQQMSTQVKNMIRETAGTDNYKMADTMRKLQSEIEAKFGLGTVEGSPILTKDRQAFESRAKQLAKSFVKSVESPQDLDNLARKEAFSELGKLLPEKASSMERRGQELATDVATAQMLNKPINPLNPGGVFTLKPALVKGADYAGKSVKKINEWTDNDVMNAVSYLYSKGKNTYASMLEKAAMAPGEKRRALMFSLSQNPEFRNSLPFTEEE